jgi:hypothetical protein
VDSIYGFAFSYYISSVGNNRADSIGYIGSLGVLGFDLYTFQDPYSSVPNNPDYRSHTLVCRTNAQNAYNINDTIGVLRFTGLFQYSPFEPVVVDFKAILADGTEIPFNICTQSMTVDTSVLIDEETIKSIRIYPNPTNDLLTITGINHSAKISIINALGEEVKRVTARTEKITIDVSDLASGIYTGVLISNDSEKRFSIITAH